MSLIYYYNDKLGYKIYKRILSTENEWTTIIDYYYKSKGVMKIINSNFCVRHIGITTVIVIL